MGLGSISMSPSRISESSSLSSFNIRLFPPEEAAEVEAVVIVPELALQEKNNRHITNSFTYIPLECI